MSSADSSPPLYQLKKIYIFFESFWTKEIFSQLCYIAFGAARTEMWIKDLNTNRSTDVSLLLSRDGKGFPSKLELGLET
jgi:hypothetical protein